ncbi:MAG: serine hydrolase [Gemmatimonadota bacterium]|nr:MAG: serine hydrolase [Gemmatimonadota bacterium]
MRTTTLAVACLAVAHISLACAQETPWPTAGWQTSTPQAQGLADSALVELHHAVEAGDYGYVDRLVVVRNGYLVMSERYEHDYRQISQGRDTAAHQYNYHHPDWHPFYMGRAVHTLQSVTKSITSALIGIAIQQGALEGTDVPMLSFFEDYDLSRADERMRRITLDDLLTMRAGIEWHETDRPVDSTNTTIQLEASDDWVQFTLDQPMIHEPGTVWVYNSGASHLLSAIIKKTTGSYIDEYAEQHLFGPLGIDEYHWKKTPKGYPDTEGGLYLETEDLAKIGYLYLNDGVWDGRRILPEGWVAASTARRVDDVAPDNDTLNWGYGYQWWRLDTDGVEVWAGLGYGGQYLLVIPERGLIGVVNSWNIFGPRPSVLGPFLQTLLESSRTR